MKKEKRAKNEPSNNLRSVTLDKLIKLRENNYYSKFYKGHQYCPDLVEAEIKRKLMSKNYRDKV